MVAGADFLETTVVLGIVLVLGLETTVLVACIVFLMGVDVDLGGGNFEPGLGPVFCAGDS